MNFTKKEVAWIIIAIIIFNFIIGISIKDDKLVFNYTLYSFAASIIIILTSIVSKKLVANSRAIKIEHKIWEFQRWGWYARSHFKKPIPIGLILPIFFAFFSLGIIKPLMLLQFSAENIPEKRILRRTGRVRKSEINEFDLSITSIAGFYSLLLLAIIGIFFKFPELIKYSIYYGIWNLIPWGNLDGAKIFFWNFLNWLILVVLFIISTILVFALL